ncbi:hypothetical protein ABI_31350 [Asticcacaulis biprosthecium C19]|uniref:Uncharacterized protein n=1 Tax=Asticcacaulis biprosthecium C19 TaxID=715226 RepID=F4QRJ6_9CAUL|nr:hypothetical protein [Asticcacaulis biprosthecium]EGF90122.1 hypothetical protein ABI_31350 [Asticcacaulis biprosthecium C19]
MDVSKVVQHLRAGRWQAVKDTIAAASPEGAYELIKLLGYKIDPRTDLNPSVSDPDDTAGLILKGGLAFTLASRARNGAPPDQMSDGQVGDYFGGLTMANDALSRAWQMTGSGLAAAFAMGCAINPLEDGQKARAEADLLGADGVPMSGYMNLMMALAEKWGGTHDDMFRVARSRLDPERPGSAALIARAHFERRLFYQAFDESADAAEQAEHYYRGSAGEEIGAASRLLLTARPGGDPAELRLAHSWLALAFFEGDRHQLAARHLDALKGYEDPTIWGLFNLPPIAIKGLIRFNAMTGG